MRLTAGQLNCASDFMMQITSATSELSYVLRSLPKLLSFTSLDSYLGLFGKFLACGWSYTLKSDVARQHGVSHMKARWWQR